ncbi:MAG: alcohol dehydrogenase catalytic domain-containing protein [Candidatus Cloacimonetes bacterium]|nr:alcohol dehydrogenase catalytic domain-containing protein [Candidatus Cloacimonadota bacterium]
MKAIVIPSHGGAEVLELRDLPVPQPGIGEVRLRIRAAALNHLDLWVRRGHPGLKIPLPFIPGSDMAGQIQTLGAGVEGWALGDEVVVFPATFCGACEPCRAGRQNLCRQFRIFGENRPGGMAEEVVVPAACLFPKPSSLSWEEAAAFPLSWLTSWHMLNDKVSHRPGDWVLIQAAVEGLAEFRVYPNPWRVSGPGAEGGSGLVFAGLPRGSTIRLHAMDGQLLETLEEHEGSGAVRWLGQDHQGNALPSGVYLYSVAAPDGSRVQGRLALIR